MKKIHPPCLPWLLIFAAIFFFSNENNAQTAPAAGLFDQPAQRVTLAPFSRIQPVAEFTQYVSEADWFQLDPAALAPILAQKPRKLRLELPGGMALVLERADPFTSDFVLKTSAGTSPAYQPGLHYRGYVADKNRDHSLAAVSIFQNEIVAVIATEADGNMTLGRLGDRQQPDFRYVFYKEKDLTIANPFQCGVDDDKEVPSTFQILPQAEKMVLNNKLVRVYVEVDNSFCIALGGTLFNVTPVVNYVAALFNVTALIYDREDVITQISEVYVWTGPDPYTAGTNDGQTLNDFRDRLNLLGSFNGDLAHLFSNDMHPDGSLGGLAGVDRLCHPTVGERSAYSGGLSTVLGFFPTYSWEFNVVTHEMGHNLGSKHTQWCGWPGGAIDNCVATEGGCPPGPLPPYGGTIMSYCHQVSTGMNFEQGFGPLPGDKIRTKVNAASCLGTVHLDCANAAFYPGGPVTANNSGGNVSASQYSCVGWNESGPERTYRVIMDEAQTITATLSGLSADLDVFILDACSESSCLAYGDVSATTATVPAGEYFVVVDGYLGAVSNFTLTVTTSVDGYCWTNGNTDEEFVANVSIAGGEIEYPSGNNEGYSNGSFSSFFPFQRSLPASLTLTPGFGGGALSENWSVWIDENNDQQFQASELRLSGGPSTQPVSGNITLPASNGFTRQECRMRVKMARGTSSNACGDGYYGETEDYKAIIDDYCIAWPDGGMGYSLQSIVINGNSVNSNEANYGNNFSQFFYAVRNGENTFTLTPHHTYNEDPHYNIGWRIYADLNHNNSFYDFGEEVLDLVNTPDVAQTGTFTLPAGTFTGWTRFRVTMGIVNGEEACGSFVGTVYDLKVWVGEYCPTTANNSQMWIEDVLLDPATGNASGQDPNGYGDFSSIMWILDRDLTHELRLYPSFAGNEADVTWRVFIDYNHDHRFDGPGEIAADLPGSTDWQIATINIPPTALNGLTRMRIQMLWLAASDACGPKVMGEIEDYSIFIDPYCKADPFYNETNWIERMAVNKYNQTSGQNAQAYTLYPNFRGIVSTAADNHMDLYPGGPNPNDAMGWRVFVDANQDGDFFDASEMVIELPPAAGNRLNVGFALPSASLIGWTRMRVVMAKGILQGPCDISFDGEVEDYAIYIDDYCVSLGVNSAERITNVTLGSINNTTDPLTLAYSNFTNLSTDLTIGRPADFSISHVSILGWIPPNPSVTIFIDYNRDHDFSDNGERAVTLPANPASPRTGTFTVPVNVTPGTTRMRIVIQADNPVNSACELMDQKGDVEDYTVNLVAGCAVPTDVWGLPSAATEAYLGQEQQSGIYLYYFRYRVQGTVPWTTVASSTPIRFITGLTPGTTYAVQARVRCRNAVGGGGDYTVYSATKTFTMPASNAACGQSTAGRVRSITPTGATFQYRYVPNAIRYRVEWRIPSFPLWNEWVGPTAFRAVTGLMPLTTYEWRVSTRCGTVWGTPYYMGTFTTLPSLNFGDGNTVEERTDLTEDGLENDENDSFTAYPNPFGSSLTLQFDSDHAGEGILAAWDVSGRRLLHQEVELLEVANTLELSTEDWAPGIYFLQLQDAGVVRQVKVVKD